MKGFDPKFKDLPDFIIGITKEIWEDRGIDTLHRYYAPDITVRSPSGIVVGSDGVIAATMATLAEFPDRQLLGEDVIWCGDEEAGFLSSHRILSTATHAGDGVYGPASGAKLRYRIIADCAVRENQVYDEWLIRDQSAIVRQLGLDPKRYAAELIEAEGGPENATRPFTLAADKGIKYVGKGNHDNNGARYAELLNRIMGAGFSAIESTYDRAVQLELPGAVTGHGWGDADSFWMGLRSSFPDADFVIHHQMGSTDSGRPGRAALRWSLQGKHSGWGSFGAPSDAEVHVMGISHAEWGPRGLSREWIMVDETAIWKQILLHSG